MAIRKSSSSGIPFGHISGRPINPNVGQPYFNGELQRLELYTGPVYGWQNIVAETPGVIGYSGTLYENSGGTITITGTNFASGASAIIIGTDGTEYTATTTTVSNLSQIVATFGPISGSKEPYDIKVVNPSNLYGVYYDILSVNDSPIWTTPAGLLSTTTEGSSLNISVSASDEENNNLTYSIASGSLPSGITLNSSNGNISGTVSPVSGDTTYNFTISVSDGTNTSTRAFSILVLEKEPVWTTSGTISPIIHATSYSYQLTAIDESGTSPSYSIVSGTLPSGISLSSSGLISGTATISSSSNLSITFRATDLNNKYSDQSITIPLQAIITSIGFGSNSQVSGFASYTGQDGITRSSGKSGPGTVGYHGVSLNKYFPADKDFELIIQVAKNSDGTSTGELNHYMGLGWVFGNGYSDSLANNLSFGSGWYGGDTSVFDNITGTKYANYYNDTGASDAPATTYGFPLYFKFVRNSNTFNIFYGNTYSNINNQVSQLSVPANVSGKDIILAFGEASGTEYFFIEKFIMSA